MDAHTCPLRVNTPIKTAVWQEAKEYEVDTFLKNTKYHKISAKKNRKS